MKQSIGTRLFSFGFAALMTLAILGSLDALATTDQSREALLAQQGPLSGACAAPDRKV